MKKTYFIADLHLSDARPDLTNLFIDFMQHIAPEGEKLYILGDLFDFWIGDDESSPVIDTVKAQIKQLTEKGIPCYFICGNRDFLVGKKFAQSCGLILLPDYAVLDLYGISTLICHGDTLCIDDVRYQQFRHKVHQKWRQWLFLRLPLSLRVKIGQKIRQRSKEDKKDKKSEIMDVNHHFVLETMENFKTSHLIHGHTHRQNMHQLNQDLKRIVLGDWGEKSSILEVTPKGMNFINLKLNEHSHYNH